MVHVPMFNRQNISRFDERIQRSQSLNRFTFTLGVTSRGHEWALVPFQIPSVYVAGRWQRLLHRRTPTSSKIWMFGAGVGHHSNGHDGGSYNRVGEGSLPEGTSAARTLNTADGSFGVNYLEVRGAVSSRVIRDVVDVDSAFTLGLDYRVHVPWTIIPGGTGLTAIEPLYGRHELRANFQQEWPTPKVWRFDHLQLALRVWTRFGAGSNAATGGSADLAFFGFAGGSAGPFVRLYGGNDYYNIRFLEKRRYVMLGIVWDHSRLTRFPNHAARADGVPPPRADGGAGASVGPSAPRTAGRGVGRTAGRSGDDRRVK